MRFQTLALFLLAFPFSPILAMARSPAIVAVGNVVDIYAPAKGGLIFDAAVLSADRKKSSGLNASEANKQIIETGILQDSCAPWDGAAFAILLDSNVAAFVYSPFESVVDEGRAVFRIEPGKKTGSIISGCDPAGKNCINRAGKITIERIEGDHVIGLIEIPETSERHMFRVINDRNYEALCG
jgi:hypothetical protein